MLHGLRIPDEYITVQEKIPQHIPMKLLEKKFVTDKIRELLSDHCIERCKYDPTGWISNIFLRDKKSGGKRMILNLKKLNEQLPGKSFKMEHIGDAQRLITQDSWMITLDISNAYFHLGFKVKYQKYLQCEWQGQFYRFTTLANGIKFGPLVFTKVCKPVLGHCRSRGIKILMYIDDIFVVADSKHQCELHRNYVITLLQTCGFLINWKKSELIPSQDVRLLGFRLNSIRMDMYLPSDRKQAVIDHINSLWNQSITSIQRFAHLIGLIISVIPVFPMGKFYYRSFRT